jgi:cephalosporin hydroxylase
MTRYLVSHQIYRWHNLLVPERDRVTLAHRETGARRTVEARPWDALCRAARRPASEAECVAALVAAGLDEKAATAEAASLIAERWLVEPADDLPDLASLDLGPPADPADLARDRLRWTRDALDTHGLWLYPRWLGFPVLQLPSDLVGMQMLLGEVRPAFLVETGLFRGGGAMFYASVFALLGHGHVIAVETRLDPAARDAIGAHPLSARITVVEGSSIDPLVVARVAELVGGPGGHVVVLDSDHSAAHVRAELEAYAPLVGPAGKLVVFDTSMQLAARWADDNPHQAVRGFLAAHPEWRVSPWSGAAFVTAAEGGILERLPDD